MPPAEGAEPDPSDAAPPDFLPRKQDASAPIPEPEDVSVPEDPGEPEEGQEPQGTQEREGSVQVSPGQVAEEPAGSEQPEPAGAAPGTSPEGAGEALQAEEEEAPPSRLRRRLRLGWKWVWRSTAGLFLLSLLAVVPWRWIPLPTTAFMVREHLVGDHESIAYRWVPMEEISPHLAIAAVASEDQLFPEHHGFDLKAIAEALEDDRGRRRGASTISQQVVKNLYLWPGRSYLRKGLEAYLTVLVEATWPKRRILEVYLNVAELGPGVFGAEAAAQAFYGKGAKNLNLYEASLLAAVLPNPKGRSAARPSPYVARRAADIRRQVGNLGGSAYLSNL